MLSSLGSRPRAVGGGFALTFVPQYILGAEGMPRRIVDYPDNPGWAELNLVSTIGALLLAAGMVPFFAAVVLALRRPADAPADPWGGNSLEWATSSPPPHHNFDSLPPIRPNDLATHGRRARRGRAQGRGRDLMADEVKLFGRRRCTPSSWARSTGS
jgi:heme/copper-type cytochrome/quinol oxidase subunit 1